MWMEEAGFIPVPLFLGCDVVKFLNKFVLSEEWSDWACRMFSSCRRALMPALYEG